MEASELAVLLGTPLADPGAEPAGIQHRDELLDEEWVAGAGLGDLRAGRRRQVGLAEQPVLAPRGELIVARADQMAALDAYHAATIGQVSALQRLDSQQAREKVPILRADPTRGSVDARVRALAERRIDFFERIGPYKRSATVQRWRSPFLQRQHGKLVRGLRADLLDELAAAVGARLADLAAAGVDDELKPRR